MPWLAYSWKLGPFIMNVSGRLSPEACVCSRVKKSLNGVLDICTVMFGYVSLNPSITDSQSKSDSHAANSMVASISVSEISTDRKSTRLNSSHVAISYAVFCLKKKKHLFE